MLTAVLLITINTFISTRAITITQDGITSTMYKVMRLNCAWKLNVTKVSWWLGAKPIKFRKGKYILKGTALEVLDTRIEDSGEYKCMSVDGLHDNSAKFHVKVNNTRDHYLSIHKNTVPINATTVDRGIYWHPIMKRLPSNVLLSGNTFDAVSSTALSVYTYSPKPGVPTFRWTEISDPTYLTSRTEIQLVDCNEFVETQSVLPGTCYHSTVFLDKLYTSVKIECLVTGPDYSQIRTSFDVLVDILPSLLLNQNKPVKEDCIDLMDPFVQTTTKFPSWDISLPPDLLGDPFEDLPWMPKLTTTTTTTTTTESSATTIDLQSLKQTKCSDFRFTSSESAICTGHNLTIQCQFGARRALLELWFLGLDNQTTMTYGHPRITPELLTFSYHEMFIVGGVKKFNIHGFVSWKIPNMQSDNSGTYICKYGSHYKSLNVDVIECADSTTGDINYVPLYIILPTASLLFIVIGALSFIVCRKYKSVAILPEHVKLEDLLRKRDLLKKVTLTTHSNLRYHHLPTNTNPGASEIGTGVNHDNLLQVCVTTGTKAKQQPNAYRSCVYKQPDFFPYEINLDPMWEFPRSQLQMEELIGTGGFGAVFRGTVEGRLPGYASNGALNNPSQTVAVKTLLNEYTMEQLVDLVRELETMKLIYTHPHVIRLLGACTQQGSPCILMEYATHGNLRDFLRKYRSVLTTDVFPDLQLDPSTLLRLVTEVADALAYFESRKLAHRDVAARNILITEGYVAKLSDFGFTRIMNDYWRQDLREHLPYRWLAPECFDKNQFTLKSDVWSFGILLWEVFSLGDIPYPQLENQQIHEWVMAGNRNSRPRLASPSMYDLMLHCWSLDVSERPTFAQLLTRLMHLSVECLSTVTATDSGICSGNRSRQKSQTSGKPDPPVRTCSLPGYHTNPTPSHYVEMIGEDYLEPRYTPSPR